MAKALLLGLRVLALICMAAGIITYLGFHDAYGLPLRLTGSLLLLATCVPFLRSALRTRP